MTAALGSACAILRAMIDAFTTVGPSLTPGQIWTRLLTVGPSALVASRSQSLVDTMIELSMVYLAAISPMLIFRLLRIRASDKTANTSMAVGSIIALSCYLLRWAGVVTLPRASALCLAIPIALGFAGIVHFYTVVWHFGNKDRDESRSRESSITDPHVTHWTPQELIAPSSGEHGTSPFR
jgi:solute:Na+ symporter, SSS family